MRIETVPGALLSHQIWRNADEVKMRRHNTADARAITLDEESSPEREASQQHFSKQTAEEEAGLPKQEQTPTEKKEKLIDLMA